MTHPKVHIGEIIGGTTKYEDIIPALLDVLRDLSPDGDERADVLQTEFDEAWWSGDRETVSYTDDPDVQWEIYRDILDELSMYAPPGVYCGTSPGDGASIGFWPDEDWLRDAENWGVRLVNFPGVFYDGVHVFISDYGNVTVSTFDIQLTELWSAV